MSDIQHIPGFHVDEAKADVRRRTRNILDVHPATGWDLAEAMSVLDALEGIVRSRQGRPQQSLVRSIL